MTAGTTHAFKEQGFMLTISGRGIVHAEMPRQNSDGSANVGIQLWVDLPEQLKDCEPRYRDVKASEIPIANSKDGKVEVKVISGQSFGVDSLQELVYTPVWLLDITIQPGGMITQALPSKWNAFAYTLSGVTSFSTGTSSQLVDPYHNVVFEREGDTVVAFVPESAPTQSRFILAAGMVLDQPVYQYVESPLQTSSSLMVSALYRS